MLVEVFKFDVRQRDSFDATPLHFAIINKEFKNVELLIKFGADVNARDYHGYTPLHLATIRLS